MDKDNCTVCLRRKGDCDERAHTLDKQRKHEREVLWRLCVEYAYPPENEGSDE